MIEEVVGDAGCRVDQAGGARFQIRWIGVAATGGRGSIIGSALESSNVDDQPSVTS